MEDAVTAAGKAVESVLHTSIRNWPSGEEGSDWLRQRGPARSEGLNSMLTSLGAPMLPDKLRDVVPAHAQAASMGRGNGLRSQLYAALVAAVLYPGHPLRAAISQLNDMITLWDGLADLRNAAAHGGARRIEPLNPGKADERVRRSVQAAMLFQHLQARDTGNRE